MRALCVVLAALLLTALAPTAEADECAGIQTELGCIDPGQACRPSCAPVPSSTECDGINTILGCIEKPGQGCRPHCS